tara:strand:- start:4959 stop:5600 length:642 start_codon:yes stop_codon:yes gene_type:complete
MENLYLACDGVEGGGKSGTLNLLNDLFTERGELFTTVREPGGTPMAEEMRNLVKSIREESVDPVTELMLMFGARRQLMVNVVMPALKKGHVLSDRCHATSRAYQLFGSQTVTESEYEAIFNMTMKGVKDIDLLLWLDVDPKLGLMRAKGRGALDRIEMNSLDFFYRAREGYQSLIGTPGFVRIDANVSEPEMHEQIIDVVGNFLAEKENQPSR